jgi:hypothetical protein
MPGCPDERGLGFGAEDAAPRDRKASRRCDQSGTELSWPLRNFTARVQASSAACGW